MSKNKCSALVLLVLLFFSASVHAELYGGLFIDRQETEFSDCSGNCTFTLEDAEGTQFGALGGFYWTALPLDLGLQVRFYREPSLNLMLRKRFGPWSVSAGAGVMATDVNLKRGINTNVGDGLMRVKDETKTLYSLGIERSVYDTGRFVGNVGLAYSLSRFDATAEGVIVTGFDMGEAEFAPTSASGRVEKSFIMLYFTHGFRP